MERINRLRAELVNHDIDGLLITSDDNRRYMSGFTGTAGAVLITSQEAILITDFRYVEQAKKQATAYKVIQHTRPIHEEVLSLVKEMGIKRLGFEQDHMRYVTYTQYEQQLEAAFIPVSSIVEKIRMIKTDEELSILKQAAEIADQAFSHILTYITPGIREWEVANELEFFMRKNGATSSSFDIIVASGYRSALPHGVASEKVIETGEFVTLDFGAYYQGYCSDITRTIAIGEPTEQLRTIYDITLAAQRLGMDMIKPGMTGKEADGLVRDYIKEKGYGEQFGHSTGHGIGLEIHEGPTLSFKSETILEPGMVVTVEPGIYLSGIGGVRIEDDTVITEDGNTSLTHSPKELLIL